MNTIIVFLTDESARRAADLINLNSKTHKAVYMRQYDDDLQLIPQIIISER